MEGEQLSELQAWFQLYPSDFSNLYDMATEREAEVTMEDLYTKAQTKIKLVVMHLWRQHLRGYS